MINLLITMFAVLMGAAVGALFSLGFIKAYRQGVKDGRAIKNEQPLEPMVLPKPTEETENTLAEQLNALAGYQPKFTEDE